MLLIRAYGEMDITRDFGSRILGSNPGGRAKYIKYRLGQCAKLFLLNKRLHFWIEQAQ